MSAFAFPFPLVAAGLSAALATTAIRARRQAPRTALAFFIAAALALLLAILAACGTLDSVRASNQF